MTMREARRADLPALLRLYEHLKGEAPPVVDAALEALWERILTDPDQRILVAEADGALVSSCVLVLVPNLTHGQRPYALIENVVTHPAQRGMGYATRLLDWARELAVAEGCYKMMLLTGSREEATLRFYERAGYNRRDKTGFVQWLE